MLKKILIISLIFGLFFPSCSLKIPDESDLPSWKVEYNFPMGEETFFANELLDEDPKYTKYVHNGDTLLGYEDNTMEIEKTEVGDSLRVDNMTETITHSVDEVKFEDVSKELELDMEEVSVDPFSENFSNNIGHVLLESEDPQSSPDIAFNNLIDFSPIPEGLEFEIPQGLGFPTIYRDFSFDKFDEATIKSGIISLQVFNDLPIE